MIKLATRFTFAFIFVLVHSSAHAVAALQADTLDLKRMVQPVSPGDFFCEKGYFVWGASVVKGDDGKYHMFYARWPVKTGFSSWVTRSEVAHAVADSPAGPFKFRNIALPARGKEFWDGICTHNPTIHHFNGKYYLYYMGNTGDNKVTKGLNWVHRNNQRIGVAVADSPNGPWQRFDKPLIDISTDKSKPDALCVANPSVTQMADGRYLMIYKAVGRHGKLPFGGPVVHLAAIADSPTGPFTKFYQPLFTKPGEKFAAEDPYIWYDTNRKLYYAVTKDMHGTFTGAGMSLALFVSTDGRNWQSARHTLALTRTLLQSDGKSVKYSRLERPQLLFGSDGQPQRIYLATSGSTIPASCNIGVSLHKFKPTVKSLRAYRCPEWFRDAKFGIYCHWNAQSASKSRHNGWYARDMYIQGSQAYKDHLKNWGHPSKVGYKDIIKAWQADKFNASEWVDIFKNAGAKYIVTVAVHHDNFDMWNSKYQPKWNSTNYGPKKDVCAEIRAATLKAGLHWGVSTHLGRGFSWFQTNKGADKYGPKKGIPYDGNDPAYQDLYYPMPDFARLGSADDQLRHPLYCPDAIKENWKLRMYDLIDHYNPDHFYFDGALPFMDDKGQSGLDVVAHFYNHNAAMHGGINQGVMVIKDITRHGFFYSGISSVIMERHQSPKIEQSPHETENSVGPWFYTGDESGYRSAKSLLHEMIDVVSKNNNFLLNIPPKGDGSIDKTSLKILKKFGNWFKTNGEAIYNTRPWRTFGEKNIRFTTRDKTLYAIVLNRPAPTFTIKSIKGWTPSDIQRVELLGGKSLSWNLTGKGLEISAVNYPEQLAFTIKISCSRPVSELGYADLSDTASPVAK